MVLPSVLAQLPFLPYLESGRVAHNLSGCCMSRGLVVACCSGRTVQLVLLFVPAQLAFIPFLDQAVTRLPRAPPPTAQLATKA